jgi:hypothetical protein
MWLARVEGKVVSGRAAAGDGDDAASTGRLAAGGWRVLWCW